jgi:hypothetical protein
VALVQQAFLLILAAFTLDGGILLRLVSGALVASWLVSLTVMLLGPRQPTVLGIAIVKFGFWFPIVAVVFVYIWNPALMGV